MNQISGLFETETGGEKSVGSGYKFKLHQILKVPNVTCQEDQDLKHHQAGAPLLNSRLRYLQNSHLTYAKLRRTSLNSFLIRFDGAVDLSGSLINEKTGNRVSPLGVMSTASVSLDRLFIAIELE